MHTENTEYAKCPVERVRKSLDELGFKGEIRRSEETIFTVEDASKAVGVPPEEILKSLLFCVEGDCGWALALMSGPNKVHDKKIKKLLNARKVRMSAPDAMFAFCGFKPGGTPPVGYERQPVTLVDEDLFKYRIVWAAAGTDHDLFPVTPEELLRITGGIRADIKK